MTNIIIKKTKYLKYNIPLVLKSMHSTLVALYLFYNKITNLVQAIKLAQKESSLKLCYGGNQNSCEWQIPRCNPQCPKATVCFCPRFFNLHAIIHYHFADYLFKFLVIGSAGTGKSCLLHQFIESKCKFWVRKMVRQPFSVLLIYCFVFAHFLFLGSNIVVNINMPSVSC